VLALLGCAWILFHRQVQQTLGVALLLRSQSPSDEAFEQIPAGLADPVPVLERLWDTGKVPHREMVISFLRDHATTNANWFTNAQKLLWAGTSDPDMSVRELALATLQLRGDARLFDCAVAQLQDPDPLVRLLGLEYLRKFDAHRALPIVIGLLDDPDLRVVATSEVALMRWTGQDFGVRAVLAISSNENSQELDPAHVQTIREGVARRKEWWQAHGREFPTSPSPLVQSVASNASTPPIQDFTLLDLEGKRVRLSDFRGKPVLINFWATWCPACLAEIPDLIALHKKEGDRIAIVGIALDGAPDEHGHVPGEDGNESHESKAPPRKAILAKVSRTVNGRGINYQVLLDPDASVGRRFNGGELPTTVIIDSQGHLRRRFIGKRSLPVFEAMLAEAAH
jgi:thiol-disulfide isomerase/thioredoxin